MMMLMKRVSILTWVAMMTTANAVAVGPGGAHFAQKTHIIFVYFATRQINQKVVYYNCQEERRASTFQVVLAQTTDEWGSK